MLLTTEQIRMRIKMLEMELVSIRLSGEDSSARDRREIAIVQALSQLRMMATEEQ